MWKLLKWCNSLTEEHKRGLRVLKTVLEVKGQKRFKKVGGSQAADPLAADILTLNAYENTPAAMSLFRRNQQKTSYS